MGVLSEQLTARCDHVTATDVAAAALEAVDARLQGVASRHGDPYPVIARLALAAGAFRPRHAVGGGLLLEC